MKRTVCFLLLFFLLFCLASQAQTITVGFTVSKTGALNVDSLEQYNGFELWRDQVNSKGGIKAGGKSYQVKFASYDDESNSKRVQQLYSRLILEDKADFLFSPYSSPLTTTSSIVSEQYGKVMLTTGAADEKTYRQGNKYLFQMFAPATQYLNTAIDLLKSKDPKATIAFVYEDAAFSVAVVNPAKDYAQKQG
ncbi:MAG: ABC transporter substrate-binding protein, partial [Terriglobales bacterium]